MSNTPAWLRRFADAVVDCLERLEPMAPIGCHYHRTPEQWEVTIFASATEVVGGARDGVLHKSRFWVDLGRLLQVPGTVETCHWQAQDFGLGDDVGANLSLEGTYEGHPVWLRIAAEPPACFPPGRQVQAYENEIVDLWNAVPNA